MVTDIDREDSNLSNYRDNICVIVASVGPDIYLYRIDFRSIKYYSYKDTYVEVMGSRMLFGILTGKDGASALGESSASRVLEIWISPFGWRNRDSVNLTGGGVFSVTPKPVCKTSRTRFSIPSGARAVICDTRGEVCDVMSEELAKFGISKEDIRKIIARF
jgi:hypothetical protein